jgi:hypothetical protein
MSALHGPGATLGNEVGTDCDSAALGLTIRLRCLARAHRVVG